jgi:glycosyltransferase involved in cell wall biosynthesis
LYNSDKVVAQEIRALGIPVVGIGMTSKLRVDAPWKLYRLFLQSRPVIVHGWMYHANIMARVVGRMARLPIIITSRRNMYIGGWFREAVKRLTVHLDDAIVAVCDAVRDVEIEKTGASPDKVVTVHNGIDADAYALLGERPVDLRGELGILPSARLIGWVGRLHPQKGLEVLLRAMACLCEHERDIHLLLVGEGELRQELERRVKALGLAGVVTLAGLREDVPDLLGMVDVFVFPSFWEGFPNAVLEAMAAGRPVVATAVGGTPELVVDGETGFLVPTGDARALVHAIKVLLDDPGLGRQMGKAGHERVERSFTVEWATDQVESLYDKLLLAKGLGADGAGFSKRE